MASSSCPGNQAWGSTSTWTTCGPASSTASAAEPSPPCYARQFRAVDGRSKASLSDRQIKLLAVAAERGGDWDARRIDLTVDARYGPGEGTVLQELRALSLASVQPPAVFGLQDIAWIPGVCDLPIVIKEFPPHAMLCAGDETLPKGAAPPADLDQVIAVVRPAKVVGYDDHNVHVYPRVV